MTSPEFQTIMACVSQMIREDKAHVGEDGVAVTGSWAAVTDPAHREIVGSTFAVTAAKTASILGPDIDPSDPDRGFAHPRIDLASCAVGDQFAPRGGERVIMLPTEAEPVAIFVHGDDDLCPTLKAGERIISHFNGEPMLGGTVDVSIRFANDGVTSGDNLGSLLMLAGALLKIATTSGSVTITANDSTGAFEVAATTVQLAGSGTASGDAVVRQSDLQNALANFKSAMVAANVTNAGAVTVPTATASAKVFAA